MKAPVLFVSYTGEAWGSDRVLGDLATALDAPVAVACPRGPLASRLEAEGVAWHEVGRRSVDMRRSAYDRVATPLRIAALAREVRATSAASRAGVVIAWNVRGLLAARVAGVGRPLVFHQHELIRGPLIRASVRVATRRADLVVATSQTVADDVGMPAQIARHGVELERYRRGWPRPGPPTVLYLGALVGWKRPDLALEAVALAAREVPEVRLLVAGAPIGDDGGLLEKLRERARARDLAGRVEFAGRIEDVAATLASVHCLLHCADREPYGIAMVEALAAAVPVVAPAAGGATEIVTPGCGRLFAPGDPRAAADALLEVLSDPEPLGRAARQEAERRHSLAAARHRYRELIEPLR